MKTFYTIIFCLVLSFAKAQQPIDTLITYITFENLKGYSKGYGTSIDRPIGSGAFANLANRGALQIRVAKLENSFRWPDGSAIDFSKRSSTSGKSGIVDRYTLTNPSTKAVVTIFVDPYHLDSVFYIPEGLVLVNKESLAKDIAPHLKKIEELNASSDPYLEQEAVKQEMNYIAMKFGIGSLVNIEHLRKTMTDTQASNDLKNYLFNAYILHKFYAMVKNINRSSQYAYNKMKSDFLKFQQKHPDVEVGNIKINLN